MPTATRGATLIVLGALLAQAPLAASRAYEPRESEPAVCYRRWLTTRPTAELLDARSDRRSSRRASRGVASERAELAAGGRDVTGCSCEAADTADAGQQMLRCFKLETENYCLGLGFVDELPTGAQLAATP